MTEKNTEELEMFVGGLVLDPNTQAPIVVLKDESGKKALPIWIGMAEAISIATILKGIPLARPMTHDLMFQAILQHGIKIKRVVISDLKDATYFAEIVMARDDSDSVVTLDSRPSDAIALALRASAPIYVASHVVEKAKDGIEQLKSTEMAQQAIEDKSAQEEEKADPTMTDTFNTMDKDKWADILADLDPDDFKYKM